MKKIMILGVLLVMILSTYSQKLELAPDTCWYQEQNYEFIVSTPNICVDYDIFAYSTNGNQYLLVEVVDDIFQIKEQTGPFLAGDSLFAYDNYGKIFYLKQKISSKWFSEDSYTYVAFMYTGLEPSNSILMLGGEKSVYRFNELSRLNFWYFGYLDQIIGYTYFGPSLSKHISKKEFWSLGAGLGFTSTNEFIYAFTFMGEKDKFHWFANTEHGVWTWHRILAGYYIMEDVSLIAGSQAFLGPGLGGKLNITPKISLETMIHMGVSKSYFGSVNDQGGISLILSAEF